MDCINYTCAISVDDIRRIFQLALYNVIGFFYVTKKYKNGDEGIKQRKKNKIREGISIKKCQCGT